MLLALGTLAVTLLSGPAFAADPVDHGSAPASYDQGPDGPARTDATGPRLGKTLADDALRAAPALTDRRFQITVELSDAVSGARLCGWVDGDDNGMFDPTERSCVDVSAGVDTAELSWPSRTWDAGSTYLRLRVGSDAAVERPTGPSDGEIEDHRVRVRQQALDAEISLTTSVTPDRVAQLGEQLAYTYTATNRGTTELTQVKVTDELTGLSPLDCTPAAPATLAPSESIRCTATREINQDDLDFGSIPNLAVVSAEAPGGDPADDTDNVSAVDDAIVRVDQRAKLTVAATAGGKARRGDRVPVNLTVTNTGNVTLTRLAFGANLRSVRCSEDRRTLAPGEQATCTARYLVTKADARKGRTVIAVVGRAEKPYGLTDTTTDDVVGRASVRIAVARRARVEREPATAAPGDGLADTGGPSPTLLIIGLGLTAAGGLLLADRLLRRSRRENQPD